MLGLIHYQRSDTNNRLQDPIIREIRQYFQSLQPNITFIDGKFGFHFQLNQSGFKKIDWQIVKKFRKHFDLNFLDHFFDNNDIGLVAFDMDNTILEIETLDDFAKFVDQSIADRNISQKIEQITIASMNGQLSFSDSIKTRLQLLANTPDYLITEFLAQPLPLVAGIKDLVFHLHTKKIQTILISGGFYPFANKIQQELGFSKIFCNYFEIIDYKLTGNYLPPLIDAENKKQSLIGYCRQNQISANHVLAIGDGANDLPMLDWAGYALGFRAKDYLLDRLNNKDWQLNFAPISSILDFWQIPK